MLKCWADSQYADGFYVLESDKEPSPWTLTNSLYDKDTACAVVAAKDADTPISWKPEGKILPLCRQTMVRL